jgi:hypothetical protein
MFGRPLHGGPVKVRMQIAQMQDREAIESAWPIWKTHNVAPHLHIACVSLASPIGPRHAKRYLDQYLHEGQVLEVQEAEPLAKSLRLVVALYAETELSMKRPESGFETAQRLVGIE